MTLSISREGRGVTRHVLCVPDREGSTPGFALERACLQPGANLTIAPTVSDVGVFVRYGSGQVHVTGREGAHLHGGSGAYVPLGATMRVHAETAIDMLLIGTGASTCATQPSAAPGQVRIVHETDLELCALAGLSADQGHYRIYFDPANGANDLAFGVSTAMPGTSYAVHQHEAPELFFSLTPCNAMSLAGRTIPLSTGDVAYPGAFTPHGFRNASSKPTTILWVYSLSEPGRLYESIPIDPTQPIEPDLRWSYLPATDYED